MQTQNGVVPFSLPAAPVGSVFNLGLANASVGVYIAVIVIFLAVTVPRAQNRMMLVAMICGGSLVSFCEPIFDVLTALWHPQIGQDTVFTFLGRKIPVWAVFGYTMYFGCAGYLTLQAFLKGVTRRSIWAWALVPIFLDIVMEVLMLHWHLYVYYGNQPLRFLNFPLYQPACNTVGLFLGVTILYLLTPYLGRSWKWFIAAGLVLPMSEGMGFIGTAIPPIYAINAGDTPFWLTQAAGLASYLFMAAWVYGVGALVAKDSPARYALGQVMQPIGTPGRKRAGSQAVVSRPL